MAAYIFEFVTFALEVHQPLTATTVEQVKLDFPHPCLSWALMVQLKLFPKTFCPLIKSHKATRKNRAIQRSNG